jgi:hypothetical protein
MHPSEIERLRKAICRSYGSSPHKKKYWLALLENHAGALKSPVPGDSVPTKPPTGLQSGKRR